MQLNGLASRFSQPRVFKVLAVVCASFSIISGSVVVYCYHRYSRMVDQRLKGHVVENTAKIYDASGKLLTSLSGEKRARRRVVEFDEIPKVLLDAVTAGEDQKFLVHHGVDFKRI